MTEQREILLGLLIVSSAIGFALYVMGGILLKSQLSAPSGEIVAGGKLAVMNDPFPQLLRGGYE